MIVKEYLNRTKLILNKVELYKKIELFFKKIALNCYISFKKLNCS